jgi:multicomponent Na+:H+ antiporter subunit F
MTVPEAGLSVGDPLSNGLLIGAVVLVLAAVAVGYRAIRGPTVQDRLVALNVVGTTAVVILALVAAALDEPGFLDVALTYALLNFLLSVGLSTYLGDRREVP